MDTPVTLVRTLLAAAVALVKLVGTGVACVAIVLLSVVGVVTLFSASLLMLAIGQPYPLHLPYPTDEVVRSRVAEAEIERSRYG